MRQGPIQLKAPIKVKLGAHGGKGSLREL